MVGLFAISGFSRQTFGEHARKQQSEEKTVIKPNAGPVVAGAVV